MPQNILAETELRYLAATPWQMISPSGNAPIIGIYQDSMLGSFRFTREKISLSPRDFMNLLMTYPDVDVDFIRKNKEHLTNFDVISQILPSITLKYNTKLYEADPIPNNVMEIRDGQYLRGQIEKSVLASASKGILHRICNDYGNMAAADFIDQLQAVVTEYMKTSSFSVGVSDLIANRATQTQIIQAINAQKLEVQSVIEKVHMGIFENNTSNTNMNEFETRLNNILNKATEQAGKIGRTSLGKDNRFLMIVNSGSKGSLINISQMISCLGQQNVDGKRIPYGFDSRTLPHYCKFDDSPEARGFIENSYISGLTAPELFFHAMGGRVGLIDTAVKTSQTGYIQRRLIKALEDIKVEYDMTVRNNRGKIVQFAYGDDGFDSTKVENQNIKLMEMSVEDVYMHYDIAGINDERTDLLNIYTKEVISRMKTQRKATMEKCVKYIDMMLERRDKIIANVFRNKNETTVRVPVAFQYIIGNIQGQFDFTNNSAVDITPLEAFEMIEKSYQKLEHGSYTKPTELFKTLYYFYLSPKDLLVRRRFHKKALEYLLETILLKYKQAFVHPGEMVGVIAGQSIGEPTTQLTLNSVTYETELLIRDKNHKPYKVQIGDFVKNHIAKSSKIEYMQDKDTTYAELCPDTEYFEVPGATEDGQTLWRRIEAVTQHPVVNKDGTNTMLKITTSGLREVTVTKAKSVLQLIDGKIVGADGDSLRIGDYLVISKKPLDYQPQYELDLREFLPPTEYLYESEYRKACSYMHEYHWWMNHYGRDFVVPHSRSDAFVELVNKGKTFERNCVYMKLTNISEYKIPEKIPLDYDFGYFMGAYAAEGCMTKHQLSIANNDAKYFEPILRLCQKFNLTTKVYRNENKIKEGWTSQDIRVYCTLLCRITEKLCGKLSHGKELSDKLIFSNPECIRGFLDAYIAGDGCITKQSNSERVISIDASSVSLELLRGIQIMLRNMDIVSTIRKIKKPTHNSRGTLPENIHQPYEISVTNRQAQKLGQMLTMTLDYKQERINSLINDTEFMYEYSKSYLTIPNKINGEIVMQERDQNTLQDMMFEQIISIEEVPNTTNYAYDLTVEDHRNFDCINGVCEQDTFHLAGVASKSNVTRGVPRIEEILRLTENAKSSSMTVFLNPMDETQKERAETYANMLEHTKLADVVKSVQIYFDPLERATFLEQDREIVEQFYQFEKMMEECAGIDEDEDESQKSKWVLRLEFDAETLLDKNITMDDIHFAVSSSFKNSISCAFSDYNDKNLVFRIRTNGNLFDKKKRKGTVESMDQSDEIHHLRNYQTMLLNKVVLRGVKGIENVMPRKLQNMVVKEDGKYNQRDTWILDTTGSNLLEVLAEDYIDSTRTYCNDIPEIFDVLGIEAARQIVFDEFNEVMEFADVYINYHHLSLMADHMASKISSKGRMISIYRTGVKEDDIGSLAKSTFEVQTEVFLDAARHGELDDMRGVSANVMCGQYGYYGTNSFNLVLDMHEMSKLKTQAVDTKSDTEKIEEMFGLGNARKDVCAKSNIMIRNNIANIQPENIAICNDNYDIGI